MALNDSIIAQQIISLKENNLKEFMFHSHSPIYVKSNEQIQEYVDYLKNREKALSVIGSGDQILNMIYFGTKVIDAFDISTFPNYYLYLKFGAIKSLTLEDYLDFFYVINDCSEKYDDLYFDLISTKLDSETRIFWNDLINFFDWDQINESTLFSKEPISLSDVIRQNVFLQNEDNYKALRAKLESVQLTSCVGNILNTYNSYNDEYDIVYLSNIICGKDQRIFKEMIDYFKLKRNGIVLSYLYDSLKQVRDFYHEERFEVKEIKNSNSGLLIRKNIV